MSYRSTGEESQGQGALEGSCITKQPITALIVTHKNSNHGGYSLLGGSQTGQGHLPNSRLLPL